MGRRGEGEGRGRERGGGGEGEGRGESGEVVMGEEWTVTLSAVNCLLCNLL